MPISVESKGKSMNNQTRTLWMEDGREAEERVVVQPVLNAVGQEDCCEERTVRELYVEKKPPKYLATRVTEKKCPVVCERVTEEVDEAGNIIERKEEQLDWGSKMRVVDHIGVDPSVKSEPTCVTREELRDLLLTPRRQVRMQETVENRVGTTNTSWVHVGLSVLIAAQVAVLGYILFFM